jgi:chromosomal replication initiation ATPase DnaA
MNYIIAPGLSTKIKMPISRTEFLNMFCEIAETPLAELKSINRKRHLVIPRQILMALLYKNYNITLFQVAEILDRDHSTCIYGIRQAKHHNVYDPIFKDRCSRICTLLSERIGKGISI